MNTGLALGSPSTHPLNGSSPHLENGHVADFKRTWFLKEDETTNSLGQKVFIKMDNNGLETKRLTFDQSCRLVVTLFGPPCSGKTEVGRKLKEALGIKSIVARTLMGIELQNEESIFTKMVSLYLDKHDLPSAPDIMMNGLLTNVLRKEKLRPGFIMVGFPLTTAQCLTYQNVFLRSTDLHLPIYLEVPDDICTTRNTAEDDSFASRLEDFNNHKDDILNGFPTVQVLHLADKSQEQVVRVVFEHIEEQFDILAYQQVEAQESKVSASVENIVGSDHTAQLEGKKGKESSPRNIVTNIACLVVGFAAAYLVIKSLNDY